MAKQGRKDALESNGKSKGGIRFRYMDSERLCDFSVDNDDPNVTDGLRLIANALAGRNISVAPAPKRLKNAGNGSTEVLEKDEEETLEQTLPFTDPEPVDAQEEEEETPGTEAPRSKRKPKTPKVPTDINLSTATLPLADFMRQKSPTEMLDKYVAVAVWYKDQFKITDVTIDRIWAAFKHLGWESQLPTDVEKPLQNLTYRKQWMQRAKAPGAYELIWTGEDAVNKMGTAKTS
jgi:hypothetical protein